MTRFTVFTSNQPRHIALLESLARLGDVFAVVECTTLNHGAVADFYPKSPVMQEYFHEVMKAESKVFGEPRFFSGNSLSLRMGDLNHVDLSILEPALHSGIYVVFGASYVKGALCDFLVEHRAVNIHMGISPQYRGSSCNFWALYDNRPDLVGGTVHLLSKGLDSGPILFHALPRTEGVDGFLLGMNSVQSAIRGLCSHLSYGSLFEQSVSQDRRKEVRYSRNADFNDQVVAEFMNRQPSPKEIEDALLKRKVHELVRPYFPS